MLRGAGGVIYAELALLPLPLALSARCSEPEGGLGARKRVLGARASRGGARLLLALPPPTDSAALGGLGNSESESESPGAETQLRRAPARLSRLLRSSPGAPTDRPEGRRAKSTGSRSPRDGLGAGARSAALLPAGLTASCRSPGAAISGGPGLRAGAAQAGEVSCAHR